MDPVANKVVWLAEDLDYAQGVLEGAYGLPAADAKQLAEEAVGRFCESLPESRAGLSVELGKIRCEVRLGDCAWLVKARNRTVLP
jgi:hypothetical protein